MTIPNAIDDGWPPADACDSHGRCWWGCPPVEDDQSAAWTLRSEPYEADTHWLPYNALPVLEFIPSDEPTWRDHPSLTAAERN